MEGKNNSNVVVILLVVIILGLVGFIVYDKVLNKDNTLDNGIKNSTKEEKLDITSGFVLSLYMNVQNKNRCFNTIVNIESEEVLASEIDYATKFQMAVDLLLSDSREKIKCDDLIKYYDEGKIENNVTCSNSVYNYTYKKFENLNETASYTTLIAEENVKTRMKQIFGSGNYQHQDKILTGSILYKYIEEQQGYVVLDAPAGGTCNLVESKLINAVKKDNIVMLTEEVIEKDDVDGDKKYNYVYTFTLENKDNSYYFTSLKIIK